MAWSLFSNLCSYQSHIPGASWYIYQAIKQAQLKLKENARPVLCQDAAVQRAGIGRCCATVTPDLDGYLVRRARARQVSGK